MYPVAASLLPGTLGSAFANWTSLAQQTAGPCAVTVSGSGGLMVDFGVELPAWVELDSPDLAPADLPLLQLGTGEYSAVDIVGTTAKQGVPKQYGGTYRLETNSQLYEGVRYGFLFMAAAPSRAFTITALRAVVQTKPVNYTGSFASGDAKLDRLWYMAAYTVRTNLEETYMGAILEERGDRYSWAGDAHVSQAASMIAFANYDLVLANINATAHNQNGIASYTLYWCASVMDYWRATGDNVTLLAFEPLVSQYLAAVVARWNQTVSLSFFGWDDRVGSGFQNASCTESQWDYRML
jgi:alpha-L-rhamnosidase